VTALGLATALFSTAVVPAATAVPVPNTPPNPEALKAAARSASLRHYLQGVYLEEQGDLHGALEEVGRAFQFEPTAPDLAAKLADLSLQTGDAVAGLEYAQRAIALGDRSGRAHFLSGTALAAMGRLADAEPEFERAVHDDSTMVEGWEYLGRLRDERGNLKGAGEAYRRAYELDFDNPEIAFRLAGTEARLGRFATADSLLARVQDLNPYQPGLLVTRAWIAEREGRYAEAARDYEHHLEAFPGDVQARRRLINAYVGLEDREHALLHARALYQQAPDDLDVARVLTSLYLRLDRNDEAAVLAHAIRRRHPGDPDAAGFAVAVLQRVDKKDEARDEADALTREAPENYRSWLVAAEVWAQDEPADRRSTEADRRYAKVREVLPDSTGAQVAYARSLSRTGRHAEAEESIRASLEREPRNAQLWLELGFAHERRKDVDGAEEAGRRALEIDPKNAQALNFLGYLFADYDRKLDEAVPLIQQALEIDPDNPFYLDSLGWAYFRQGRLDDARVQLERALDEGGDDPEIYEHLGDVYRAMARSTEAKSQYQKALQLNPTSQTLARKLEALR
jgi:tetratricopeptide (TPR) repeat protein